MIRNYVKLAIKVLRRRKFFTFISLFGISLTLVVLVFAAAVLDNFFVPRSPESRLERGLVLYTVGQYGPRNNRTSAPGYGFLDRYVRDLPGAEKTTFFTAPSGAVTYTNGRTIETNIRRADGAYWQVLDFDFVEGHPFTQADDDAARPVAVITDELRAKVFGNGSAIGKTIELGAERFQVIGVVKAVPVTRLAGFSEIWVPTGTLRDRTYRTRMSGDFGAIVLARSRADFPKIRAAFAERLRHVQYDEPGYNRTVAGLDTTFEAVARMMTNNDLGTRGPTVVQIVLAIAALLFMTLPTLNLVTINLSRIMERASEIGVRKAFGASTRALVGQFVVENVVLTLLGGLLGFVLATIALAFVNRLTFIPYTHFDVNLRIFGWGLLIAALFGVLSGAYPAWRMSRLHPVNALRGGAQ